MVQRPGCPGVSLGAIRQGEPVGHRAEVRPWGWAGCVPWCCFLWVFDPFVLPLDLLLRQGYAVLAGMSLSMARWRG